MGETRSKSVAAWRGSATLVTLATIPCVLACATGAGVREKSAASQKLYADLDKAYAIYVRATASFLEYRDRLQNTVDVASGREDATPAFVAGAAENRETKQVLQALEGVGAAIGKARVQFGVVNRFLQIEIFDEEEAAEVTRKLNEALEQGKE